MRQRSLTQLILILVVVGCGTLAGSAWSANKGITSQSQVAEVSHSVNLRADTIVRSTSTVVSRRPEPGDSAGSDGPIESLDSVVMDTQLIADISVDKVIRRAWADESGKMFDANGKLKVLDSNRINEPVGFDAKERKQLDTPEAKASDFVTQPIGIPFTEYEVTIHKVFFTDTLSPLSAKATLRVPGHVPSTPVRRERNKDSRFVFPQEGDRHVFLLRLAPDGVLVLTGWKYGRLDIVDGKLKTSTQEIESVIIDGSPATIENLSLFVKRIKGS